MPDRQVIPVASSEDAPRLAARRIVLAAAGLALLALARPAVAQHDQGRALVRASSPSETPADGLTRAQTLDRLAGAVQVAFDGQPLHDVIRYLSLEAAVPLEPLWTTEAFEIGLDPMLPIALDARGLTALETLERVLELAGEVQRLEHGATWQFSPHGVVEFGPRERLNRPAALRAEVYDVQDLLATMPAPPPAPRLSPSQAVQAVLPGQGGGGWIFPGEVPPTPIPPEQGDGEASPAERLVDLITTSVEPEQWVRNGGEAGIIEFFDGALIVLAPDYIHRGLAGPLGVTDVDMDNQTKGK